MNEFSLENVGFLFRCHIHVDFPDGSDDRESTCNEETRVQPLGWEDSLEKGMATHSSIVAWRIPWTEEPGGFTVHDVSKSWTQLSGYNFHFFTFTFR